MTQVNRDKQIGEQIRNQRLRKGLTIYRVAKDTGITHDTVTAIEKGESVRLRYIQAVIDYLGGGSILIKWN